MPSKTPKVQPHCGDGKVSVRIGFFSWFIKMMFCTFCHLPVVALPTGWISKSCQTNTWHGVMTQQPLEVILILNTMLKKTIKQKNGQNHDSVFCRLILRNSMDDACLLVNTFWSCFLEFRPANTTNKQLNLLDLICMVHGTFVTKHCTVQTQKHVMFSKTSPKCRIIWLHPKTVLVRLLSRKCQPCNWKPLHKNANVENYLSVFLSQWSQQKKVNKSHIVSMSTMKHVVFWFLWPVLSHRHVVHDIKSLQDSNSHNAIKTKTSNTDQQHRCYTKKWSGY